MKNKKIYHLIIALVLLALAAAEGLLTYQVLTLNMLPGNYLIFFIAALVLVPLFVGLLLLPKRPNKYQASPKKGIVRRIIGFVLAALVIAGSLVASQALFLVNRTISAVTSTPTVSDIVDVYVLADDPAHSIEDAAGYTFAITDAYDLENTEAAVAGIGELLGTTLDTRTFDSVFSMLDALYSQEVDALIINSAYAAVLEESEGYEDFATRTRLLYEYIITVPAPTEPQDATEPTPEETPVNTGVEAPFVIYLSGSDTRSSVLARSRSDVNILAAVNPQTKQILLLNTPRDCYVANPAGGGAKDKLTHCGLYGVSCSMEALSNLYSEEIKYYAQINFTGFQTLIDAVGGVDVYSEKAFYSTGCSFTKGMNHLNGTEALVFARERYSFASGDNARGKNQMKIITAVINKMCSGTTLVTNYAEILRSLEGMFTTNMTQDEISTLMKMQLSDMASWNVQSYAITGTGASATNYSMPKGVYSYVMYPNQNTVDLATELLDRVMAGEILTSEDLNLN